VKSLHMFIFNIHYASSTKKWITVINITVHIISMLYESYLLIYTHLVIIIDNQQDNHSNTFTRLCYESLPMQNIVMPKQ